MGGAVESLFYGVFAQPPLSPAGIARGEAQHLRVIGSHVDKVRDVLPVLAAELGIREGLSTIIRVVPLTKHYTLSKIEVQHAITYAKLLLATF